MAEDNISKSSNIIIAVIFVAVLLGVLILALTITFNAITTADATLSNKYTTVTINNETGYLNGSGYLLSHSTDSEFNSPSIIRVYNRTSGVLLASGNYTLVGNRIYNATSVVYNNASISYSYSYAGNTSLTGTFNSIETGTLGMITNFFALAPTIGTILAVVILVAGIVILVFYVRKMKDNGSGDEYYG